MKRMRWAWMVVLGASLMPGACGVPRAALDLARVEACRGVAETDAEVRAGLAAEPARWERLVGLLRERELGGIGWVDGRFVEMVDRTAATARRSAEIVAAGEDRPEGNRELAGEFARMWGKVAGYLGRE